MESGTFGEILRRPSAMAKPAPAQPPVPPKELMARVGLGPASDIESAYLHIGDRLNVDELLGPEWSWEGRRVLDFGCGCGRLLRQFLDEARLAEFHGSDTDAEMISWVRKHLCPPIADVRVNGERPPLDYPDDHFDLVTAFSVFTHIADGWSDWMLEIHRVLKPSGLLIATFLDSAAARTFVGLPWDEERGGMGAVGFANPETSLPDVFHSHWWLREHWGRPFEIVELRPGALTQGWVLLRAREVELTPEQLEREDPDDRRYYEARRYQFELLRAEGEELRRRARRSHDELVQSASWRLTAPLRRAKALLRRQ
jgi:ubiquinone/menaquinone biosynthesis C-methylase UbiE